VFSKNVERKKKKRKTKEGKNEKKDLALVLSLLSTFF